MKKYLTSLNASRQLLHLGHPSSQSSHKEKPTQDLLARVKMALGLPGIEHYKTLENWMAGVR